MGYFLDDSGNFENLVKIWPPTPPNYHQNTSKHTRKIMESSLKNIIFDIWASEILRFFEILERQTHHFFDKSFWIFKIFPQKYFSGDEDLKIIYFPLIKCTKAWIWISYLSKNMKYRFGESHQTPIFFENVLAPPPSKKIGYRERFQRIFRWWILGILGQSYFWNYWNISKSYWIKNIFQMWPIIYPRI